MSRRSAFLAGGLAALVVVLGAWLASQILFAQPPSANVPIVGAQSANGTTGIFGAPQQQTTPNTPLNVLTVSGIGRSNAAPDIARLTVGAEAVGANVGTVMGEVNTKQAAIIAKLKALGVADKDIQTTNFNVSIDRSKPPTSGVPDGPLTYRASNNAQITVRKLDQLSAILQAAVDAGANNVYGIQMSLADTTSIANEARTKAVADAKSKADALAKAAGLKLGRIISISELNGGVVPGPVFRDSAVLSAAPIESGELQVNVQVQVVFALEQ
ncbi:MAG: SIMPL domain-containing protein [Chloroflexi bacterium]|nr:SIMPL domain-containing protein [Chloroflexota bacterium]